MLTEKVPVLNKEFLHRNKTTLMLTNKNELGEEEKANLLEMFINRNRNFMAT